MRINSHPRGTGTERTASSTENNLTAIQAIGIPIAVAVDINPLQTGSCLKTFGFCISGKGRYRANRTNLAFRLLETLA
jgi:hypothetical protein